MGLRVFHVSTALALVFLAEVAAAQTRSTSGDLVGTIADTSGATVPARW